MERTHSPLHALQELFHRYFLAWLLGSYLLAAVCPAPGLWIRSLSLGTIALLGESTRLTLPMLMLGVLLFNAGLGVRLDELRSVAGRPRLLLAGLAANLALPIAYIFLVSAAMTLWHNADEVQNILVGLALVASMPIAGSSAAWSQNANGNLALSLSLVFATTLLSPITTPVALHAVGFMTRGDYAEDLHELASHSTGIFLTVCVVAPTALALIGQAALGPAKVRAAKPLLKLANSINLILLNYSNASVALPKAVAHPDPDFLIAIFAIVIGLCVLAFSGGWLLARIFRGTPSDRIALMFGLGMNNNGTGLVLASLALADHPRVLLPIIAYNLVQHLVAGGADYLLCVRPSRSPEAGPQAR